MAITFTRKTNDSDIEHIHKESNKVAALTPRALSQLKKLSKKQLVAVAKDEGKIIGWIISEPLTKTVFELGLGFVEKTYRGRGLLYEMLSILITDKNKSYVFATFEPKIIRAMNEKFHFHETSLKQILFISRGKFALKRLTSLSATKRVASHLKNKKPMYGLREAKEK